MTIAKATKVAREIIPKGQAGNLAQKCPTRPILCIVVQSEVPAVKADSNRQTTAKAESQGSRT